MVGTMNKSMAAWVLIYLISLNVGVTSVQRPESPISIHEGPRWRIVGPLWVNGGHRGVGPLPPLMASVFMITTSTITIYTGIAPRWQAVLGFALALLLLVGSFYFTWSFLVFPLWVFLPNACILRDSISRPR